MELQHLPFKTDDEHHRSDPPAAWFQVIVGIGGGLVAAVAAVIVGLTGISLPFAAWVLVFCAVWGLIYVLLRKRWLLTLIAAVTIAGLGAVTARVLMLLASGTP